MVELTIELPFSRYEYKLVGVYKIQFDTGEFYIGASGHIRSRAASWAAVLKDPSKLNESDYASPGSILERIKAGGSAILTIVELCHQEDLRIRESEYLNNYKDDEKMVSKADCSWKPVLQYKKDGHFIKRHVSIKSAARYNETTVGRIQDVLNGVRGAHKDMIFVYENDYSDRRKKINKARSIILLPKKNKMFNVNQLDNDGNIITTFQTYAKAGREVGCHPNNIRRAISGKQGTAGGYKWSLETIAGTS